MSKIASSCVKLTPHTMLQELSREAVLLNLQNNQYYRLNQESLHILKTLLEAPSVEDALQRLVDDYEVAPDQMRGDLQSFMLDLEQNGLISVQHEACE